MKNRKVAKRSNTHSKKNEIATGRDFPFERKSHMAFQRRRVRFVRLLRAHLAERDRAGQTLLSLSLTFPEWTDPRTVLPAMHQLVRRVSRKHRGDIWLIVEETEDGRFHVHGIAITTLTADWFSTTWSDLTGAKLEGMYVVPTTGQEHSWDCNMNQQLRLNLNSQVLYAVKAPTPSGIGLTARVVANGELEDLWRGMTGCGSVSAELDIGRLRRQQNRPQGPSEAKRAEWKRRNTVRPAAVPQRPVTPGAK